MTHSRRSASIVAAAILAMCSPAIAQQTASSFTYQGRLTSGGAGVVVKHDFAFTLYNDDVGGVAVSDTVVKVLTPADGLFTTELDFGAEALIGSEIWLQIAVGPSGGPAEILSPRQRVTPAPSAVQSGAITTNGFQSDIDPNGDITSSIGYIDNTAAIDDTFFAESFWQSFYMAKAERLGTITMRIKRPTSTTPAPGPRIVVGSGPGGQVVKLMQAEWVNPNGTGFQDLLIFERFESPVLLEGNQVYTLVLNTAPGDGVSFSEVPITDPNARQSASGPNIATSFEVEVADGVRSNAFFRGSELTVSKLEIYEFPDYLYANSTLSIQGSTPTVSIVDTEPVDIFGNQNEKISLSLLFASGLFGFADTRWNLLASPDAVAFSHNDDGTPVERPQFNFEINPQARGWLMSTDIGLTEAAFEGDDLIIEEEDAVLGLYSNEVGAFGSTIALGQVDDSGAFLNKWSISRRTTSSANELQFAFGTNYNYGINQVNFALRTDGSAWLRGPLIQNSTATEKHDIETLTGAIDTLLKLRGVSYKWNETETPDIGFVAEEMAEVMPEIVGFDENDKPIGINYGRLTALIVEATKDQQKQIDAQRVLIERLTERLDALEATASD